MLQAQESPSDFCGAPQRGICRTSLSFGSNFYLVAEAQIRKPVKRMAVINIVSVLHHMMQCSSCLTWQSHTVFIRIENRRHSTNALLPENKIIARYEKGWKMQEMW